MNLTVSDLMLPKDGSMLFTYGPPHFINVEIRRPSEDDQARGHSTVNAFCTATCMLEPDQHVRAVFSDIEADHVFKATGAEPAETEYVMSNGLRIHLPPFEDFPKPFRSFVTTISDELLDFARRTVAVLRWRSNQLGPHNPIRMRDFSWSADGAFWHPLPPNLKVTIETYHPLRVSRELQDEIAALVAGGGTAPLHHDVYREAWEQRHNNPRSATVLGIAAAELAVKHCVAELIPDSRWLVTNLQTPPLIQIVSSYFPQLPAKCRINESVKSPPQSVVDDLRKGILLRNQIAHAGIQGPRVEAVESILLSVRDLLFLVDFYTGHEWAFDCMRPETKSALSET